MYQVKVKDPEKVSRGKKAQPRYKSVCKNPPTIIYFKLYKTNNRFVWLITASKKHLLCDKIHKVVYTQIFLT